MNFTMRLLALLMVTSLAFPSCVSKKKFNELENERAELASSLAESQEKVTMLEGKVSELESDMANQKTQFEGDIANLRNDIDAAKKDLANAKKELNEAEAQVAKMKGDIRTAFGLNDSISVEMVGDDLVVTLDNPVTYRSGSSRLNRDARKAVESLATTLKNNPNLTVMVEGHADTQKFPADAGMDNWQLSVNRAMAVVKRLIRQGVDPDQLIVAGRGDTQPVAPNDTREGRAENRRTEIQPAPKSGKIMQSIGN